MASNQNPVIATALDLAAEKVASFPVYGYRPGTRVCACGKAANCEHPGKHPRTPNGLNDATTDPGQLKKWFNKSPNSHLGVVPGTGSYVVVDNDTGEKGDEEHREERMATARASLAPLAPMLDSTFSYETPSGGRHAWFKLPAGTIVRSGNNKLGKFIDVKSDGGYAVYWLAHGYPSNGLPIQPAPAELIKLLTNGTGPHTNGTSKFDRARAAAGVPESERQETLFKLACSARGRRVPIEQAKAQVRAAAAKCTPPFPDDTDALVERTYATYAEPDVLHVYYIEHAEFYRPGKTAKSPPKRISSFTLSILQHRHYDSGARPSEYRVRMTRGPYTAEVNIPDDQFNARSIDKWIPQFRIPKAVVEPGEKEHLIAATHYLSDAYENCTVYQETGWRKIDGVWRYLHAGCEDVELERPLDEFRLPAPVGAEELQAAIRAAFNLRNISPTNPLIGYTALAAAFLAALGIRPPSSSHSPVKVGAVKVRSQPQRKTFFPPVRHGSTTGSRPPGAAPQRSASSSSCLRRKMRSWRWMSCAWLALAGTAPPYKANFRRRQARWPTQRTRFTQIPSTNATPASAPADY